MSTRKLEILVRKMPFNGERHEMLKQDLQQAIALVKDIAIRSEDVAVIFPLDSPQHEHPETDIVVSGLLLGPHPTRSALNNIAFTIHEVLKDYIHKCVMGSQRVRISLHANEKQLEDLFEADIPFEMKNLVRA
jgi:hypothetical protein